MGLDGVELIMGIEDEFGITISDPDAFEMRTVGDLAELCFERIHAAKTIQCPSVPCFISVRQLVRDIRNDPDLRIRPSDNVENFLQVSERKHFWRKLRDVLKTTPRSLRRPQWLRRVLVFVVLGFPIAFAGFLPLTAEMLLFIWLATLAFGIALNRVTLSLRTRTPDGYTTFGDIAKRMDGLTVSTKPPANTDYDSVFSIVKRVVVDQLGVDEDEVVPSARFVEDLRVG